MKLVIFAGHHKVGSTSLQDFLARNSVALARAGILYPFVDFEGAALMLARALGRGAADAALPINAREPHNALAFRMLGERRKGGVPPFHKGLPGRPQMFRAIQMQTEALAPGAVVLASEVMANFAPADPAMIAELAGLFPGAEITVLFTLRRIDDYLASWHGQRLKFGHKVPPLSQGGAAGYFNNIHFNYRLMLEGWLKTLPQARFVLREYGQVRAAGGSVADFIAQSGLSFPRGLEAERKTNESLHRGIYEIARQGNAALPGPAAGKLRQVLRELTPRLGLPASDEIELFGPATRAEMAARFAPVAAFLEEVSGRAPFFPEPETLLRPRPVAEAEAHARAVAGLLRHRQTVAAAGPELGEFLDTLAARADG